MKFSPEVGDYVILKDDVTLHKMVNHFGIVKSVYQHGWMLVEFDYIPDEIKDYMDDICFNVKDIKKLAKTKDDLYR